jgi:hypothetical protein
MHFGPGAVHQGIGEVFPRIKRYYIWSACKKDVAVYINSCEVCNLYKKPGRNARAQLGHLVSTNRFDIVALDVFGGRDSLPGSYLGNRLVLTIIDLFTKYVVAVPLADQRAETITRAFLQHWVLHFGPPLRVHTDQGTNFMSNVFTNFCTAWRIGKTRTTPYHPQGNGACERVNGTLTRGLCKTVSGESPEHWDNALAHVVFAYNTSVHKCTGVTPYELIFGEVPRLVADLHLGRVPTLGNVHSLAQRQRVQLQHAFENVRVHQRDTLARSKDHYDLGACTRTFKVGDIVRIRAHNINVNSKFSKKWSDPHEIITVRGVTLELKNTVTGASLVVHHDRVSDPERILRDTAIPTYNEAYRPDMHSDPDTCSESGSEDHTTHGDPKLPDTHKTEGPDSLPGEGEPGNHSGDPTVTGYQEPLSQNTQNSQRASQRSKKSTKHADFDYTDEQIFCL